MKKVILAAVAALALLVPMSASAAPRTHSHGLTVEQQNYILQMQVRRLSIANHNLRVSVNTARINTLAARAERDTALEGLPNAIRVLPRADFFRLVFSPAFSVYPCHAFMDTGTNWTFSFSKTC